VMSLNYLDAQGLYPWLWQQSPTTAIDLCNDTKIEAKVILSVGQRIQLVKGLYTEEPHEVSVWTGPLGIENWLGLPLWVRLVVYPDGYEVKARVSPSVQEYIWSGLNKLKAKNKVKKDGEFVSWGDKWQPVEPTFTLQPTLLPQVQRVALDFETDAQWKFKAQPTGLAISDGQQQYWMEGLTGEQAWNKVLVEQTPVFHGGVYDQAVAMGQGWQRPTEFEDTELLAFSAGEKWTDDARTLGLKVLAKTYLNREMRELKDFIPAAQFKRQGTVGADVVALAQYAKEDARATLDLLPILMDKTHKKTYELEKTLVPVVLNMERAGFPLDEGQLVTIRDAAVKGMDGITNWIYSVVGWSGNLRSPDQVASLVFDRLGLRSSLGRSTSKEAMQELKWHPVCKRVRAWRKLNSLRQEAEALLAQYYEGGYAYTNFNQAGASTGRFTSRNPINLQNKTSTLRKAFIAESASEVVYRADYSQIELRVAATLSNDQTMLQAIREGRSLHKDLHTQLTGLGIIVPYEKVKTFDFSLFYGADVDRVMLVLDCNKEQAVYVIDGVSAAWSEAMAWRKKVVQLAKDAGGFNTSLDGRPYYYPLLFSDDMSVRSHTERTVVNKPIQGTALDCLKKAMVGVPELHAKYGGQMRLTVHDEVCGTVPKESMEEFSRELRCVMLEAEPRIPLDVEIGFGDSWKTAKPH
jgi:DNA polymerase I-like protein with 3'-5' exonuclease and polymerase domains